jgi:hypothetical protein
MLNSTGYHMLLKFLFIWAHIPSTRGNIYFGEGPSSSRGLHPQMTLVSVQIFDHFWMVDKEFPTHF